MSRARIADVLQELGSPRPPPSPAVSEFISEWVNRKTEQDEKKRGDIERAFADGLAEGQRQAEAERVAMEQFCAARSAEDMEMARRRWSAEEGQALARSVSDQLAAVRDHTNALVIDVLEPIIAARVRRACHDELMHAVRKVLDVKGAARVLVRARGDIASIISANLTAEGIAHEVMPADTPDAVICLDETTIATSLRNLLPRLEDMIA